MDSVLKPNRNHRMLYRLHESQRSVMEPFADFARATAKMISQPGSVFAKNPMAQRIAASYDLVYRFSKDYEKPQFNIPTVQVDGIEVAIHERVEIDRPFCELRRFKRFSDDTQTLQKLKSQPPVLLVAPLSGHYATLLRDTVRTMLKDHKVYITDWKNARLVPVSDGEFHLDDYVNHVQDFIRHIQDKYGNCHVVSVCQPTVPVLAAVSLMASRGETTPLSMTMMGGPIDARCSPTGVNDLAVKHNLAWFKNNVIYPVPKNFPGAGRRVYPGFLQYTGFVAMNPNRHASSHYDYFKDLIKGDEASVAAHRRFYDEYNAVLDMDANYYLETIKVVFQDYALANGTWDVRHPLGHLERVRPQDIKTTALMTIEGELDDISGNGQTRAAHALCTGVASDEKRHLEAKGAGHYGIFSGKRWREDVYPALRQFILDHDRVKASEGAPETLETPAAAPSMDSQHKIVPPASDPPHVKKVQKPAQPQPQAPERVKTPAQVLVDKKAAKKNGWLTLVKDLPKPKPDNKKKPGKPSLLDLVKGVQTPKADESPTQVALGKKQSKGSKSS